MQLRYTRDVVNYSLRHLYGDLLDLGAGSAKYKDLVLSKVKSYTTFDQVKGDHIDHTGDILETNFDDGSFDSVMCNQVLEHIPEPWKAAREIFRILRPQGICLVTAPFMIPYHPDPDDYYRYTTSGLEHIFKNIGFTSLECHGYGGIGTVFSESFHHGLFSPYKKKKFASNSFVGFIQKIGQVIDSLLPCDVIYANVYLIACKTGSSKD